MTGTHQVLDADRLIIPCDQPIEKGFRECEGIVQRYINGMRQKSLRCHSGPKSTEVKSIFEELCENSELCEHPTPRLRLLYLHVCFGLDYPPVILKIPVVKGQEVPFWGAPVKNVTRLVLAVSLGSWLSQNVGQRDMLY